MIQQSKPKLIALPGSPQPSKYNTIDGEHTAYYGVGDDEIAWES